jgi:tRNA C32,U32 (ribose-2'-O)-methylase TrmJ
MSTRADECLENAQRCETLAKLQRDATVKAGLEEAARHWRKRKQMLEQAQCTSAEYWGAVLKS